MRILQISRRCGRSAWIGCVLLAVLGMGCGFSIQLPGIGNVPAAYQFIGNQVDIPFTSIGGYIIVETYINDMGPYQFLLDTGASVNVVSPAVAATLPQTFTGITSIVSNVDPNSIRTQFILIDRLDIGQAKFLHLQAAILPPITATVNHQTFIIDGILGIPLFQNLLLTLDYPAHQVRLQAGGVTTPDECIVLSTVRGPGDLPSVYLDVNGRNVLAVIDSGNNEFLLLPQSYEDLDFIGPLLVGTASTVTGTLQTTRGTLNGNVQLGCHTFTQPAITVGGGIATLGAGLLSRYVVSIDQLSGTIWLQGTL